MRTGHWILDVLDDFRREADFSSQAGNLAAPFTEQKARHYQEDESTIYETNPRGEGRQIEHREGAAEHGRPARKLHTGYTPLFKKVGGCVWIGDNHPRLQSIVLKYRADRDLGA